MPVCTVRFRSEVSHNLIRLTSKEVQNFRTKCTVIIAMLIFLITVVDATELYTPQEDITQASTENSTLSLFDTSSSSQTDGNLQDTSDSSNGYGSADWYYFSEPVCNQTSQNQNIFPDRFVIFQAYKGDSYSIGEVLFILAKFPDSSCSVPDPGQMKGCAPRLEVNIATSQGSSAIILLAAPSASDLQSGYSVDFAEQPELYTDSGVYSKPWVFVLQVTAGMRTASLDVNSLLIPKNCSSSNATFKDSKVTFSGSTLIPSGISVDTTAPEIVSVYTAEKSGTYTEGHFIDIIVKFSKDVEISDLPGKYSDVYLDAQANGTMLFGVPYLELNSNAFVTLRGYENSKDRSKLSFLYQVGKGEETPPGMQLDLAANSTIQLNGGSISGDLTGLDVNLDSMPAAGATGSMSDKTRAKIYISKTGEKFPPHRYDPSSTPDTSVVATGRRNGQISYSRRVLKPTLVSVDLQLIAIFNVNEKAQQLQADFILLSSWNDTRLANPTAPALSLYSTTVLETGRIWSPRLTFHNRRDLTNPIEGVVRVYNTGQVVVIQRFIASYAVNLNMRDFPFDTQTLRWNIRSTTYDKSVLKFVPASPAVAQNASMLLADIVDPTFVYSDYTQTAYTLTAGVFTNYDLLSISIKASRISTMSSIFLVFPLCVISAVLCLVLHQEPAKDARLSVPMAVITTTMSFSFVVSNVCPPVSYMTRIHLLILQTYLYAVAALVVNYYLWCIEFARKELSRLNNDNKTLLNDAHWMPRKIKPPPTNVVVLPEGIHKPESKAAQEEPMQQAVQPKDEPKPTDNTEAASPAKNLAANGKDDEFVQVSVVVKASVDTPEKPDKSAETGAYPNKDGSFMDVMDLLQSDEVKTFKKLKWGGGPLKMLWGFATLDNGNSTAWGKHVERVDNWVKNVYPPGIVATICCILFVKDFAGLGNGPIPYLGELDID